MISCPICGDVFCGAPVASMETSGLAGEAASAGGATTGGDAACCEEGAWAGLATGGGGGEVLGQGSWSSRAVLEGSVLSAVVSMGRLAPLNGDSPPPVATVACSSSPFTSMARGQALPFAPSSTRTDCAGRAPLRRDDFCIHISCVLLVGVFVRCSRELF